MRTRGSRLIALRASSAGVLALLLFGACDGETIETPLEADGGSTPVDDGGDAAADAAAPSDAAMQSDAAVPNDGADAEAGPPPSPSGECPAGSCDYETQLGCAAGQACWPSIQADGQGVVPACSGVDGPLAAGSACTSWNDCARGTLCVMGTCRTLCCGGEGACPAGESCYGSLFIRTSSSSEPIASGAKLCLPADDCDLFDPDSCGSPDLACQIVDGQGSVGCVQRGSAEFGDACRSTLDCAPGFTCAGKPGYALCRRLCRMDGSVPCPPAEGLCKHPPKYPADVGQCTPGW